MMDKDLWIMSIENRIKSEYRKHKDLEWEKIAASKIYADIIYIIKQSEANERPV